MYLLTQQEAAEVTRLSERTLERHRWAGTGPKFVHLGRRVLYRREDIEEWIAANTCSSTSEADAMTGRCGKTENANIGDLEHPIAEISAGTSQQGRKPDGPYPPPPSAGKGAPLNFERYHACDKNVEFSSARRNANGGAE